MIKQGGSNNFWISYADLMAGLLFVFILLIGAIIVKSSILKRSLESKSEILEEKSIAISQKDILIANLKRVIRDREESLEESRREIALLGSRLKSRDENISKLKREIIILTDEVHRSSSEIVRLGDIIIGSELRYTMWVISLRLQREEELRYLNRG